MEAYFKLYKSSLEYTRNRVIVLGRRNENGDGRKAMVLEWRHRWKRSYVYEVKRKFKEAIDWYSDHDFVHVV